MSIVAISRQVGSFGEEIAGLVAEKLDYQMAGVDMIHQLADSCDPDFKEACALFEREVPAKFWERYFLNSPAHASLFESLNFELASRNNIVLLGRGSQVILGQTPDVLKVRIVAPLKTRVNRIAEREGWGLKEAEEYAQHIGHQRSALIQQIYNIDLSNWALYDMIINTAVIPAQGAARAVCEAVASLPPVADEKDLRVKLKRQAFAKLVESAIRKKVMAAAYRSVDVSCPSPGKIIISGVVPERDDKEMAGKIATHFNGVEEVTNEIKVVGLSF